MVSVKKLLRPQEFGRKAVRGQVLAPLSVIGFTLMGTILLSTLFSLQVIRIGAVVLGIGGLLLAVAAVWMRKKSPVRLDFAAVVCIAAAIALMMAGAERDSRLEARERFAGQEATVSGTVSSVVNRSGGGNRFLIKNAQILAENGASGRADILFYTDGDFNYCGGEKTVLKTKLEGEVSLSQIGMGAQLISYRAEYLEDTGFSALYPLYRARQKLLNKLRSRIYTCLPRENADLLIGMLTGSREQISDGDYVLLQGAGLAHLLAVSGLHIAIFFSLAQFLLQKLGRRIALLAALPITAGYVFLTGASVSSRRAFWMILLLTLAELLRMPKSSGNALGLSVILFCITEPMCVLQSGTILTILSVWCLYAVAPAVRLPEGRAAAFLRGGVASVCISVVTIPVMMLMTGYLPMLSPFCSILALPVMPAVLVLGLFCGILGVSLVGKMIGSVANLLITWIRFCAQLGSAGPKIPLGGELVRVCCGAVAVLLVCSVVIFGFRRVSLHRSLFAVLTAVMIAVTGLCSVFMTRREEISIACLGDMLVLQKGRQALAVGSGKNGYAGQTAASYLRSIGVTELTLLIPEEKASFTGGAYDLLVRFPTDTVLAEKEAAGDSRLLNALAASEEETELVPLESSSLWQLFGTEKMSVRPGREGMYIFLELGEYTITLQDKDDPIITSSDSVIYYDDPSNFPVKCAILSAEDTSGDLAEEMPPWEAGFLQPDWRLHIGKKYPLGIGIK